MMTKWVNVLLPYGQSALSEQQEAQAELDDEKAKVQRDSEEIILFALWEIVYAVPNWFLTPYEILISTSGLRSIEKHDCTRKRKGQRAGCN